VAAIAPSGFEFLDERGADDDGFAPAMARTMMTINATPMKIQSRKRQSRDRSEGTAAGTV
jgi:hypothetical protein